MYSRNDYRYYLENRLMHSDDFLAHYGVKGMKWHKKKEYVKGDSYTINSSISGPDGVSHYTNHYYGQDQKKQDKRADRKQMKKLINNQNKYRVDKKKSISDNIKSNKNTLVRRRKLKKDVARKVDVYYGDAKPNAQDKKELSRDMAKAQKKKFQKNLKRSLHK